MYCKLRVLGEGQTSAATAAASKAGLYVSENRSMSTWVMLQLLVWS
jgi:hypothetical protein